jgi:hypothetical protein
VSRLWAPVLAGVEWHAGRRGLERPQAVLLAGARVEVTLEESLALGPGTAGLPSRTVFVVRDGTGRRFRITLDSRGEATVDLQSER